MRLVKAEEVKPNPTPSDNPPTAYHNGQVI